MARMNRPRQTPRQWTPLTVAAAGVATLSLAACAGGGDEAASGQAAQDAKLEDAALKHARCMRQHGVDVPDPESGAGGIILPGGPASSSSPAAQKRAQDACAKYLENLPPPQLSDEQKDEMRDGALEHARCMREQGIAFPDPEFDAKGGASVELDEGFDPTDPAVERANQACAKHLPERFGGGSEPPS